MDLKDISFDIQEHLGVICTKSNGWSLELTKVAWNGKPAKFDVREWTPDYTRMTRGMAFTDDEMQKFVSSYRLWRKNCSIDDVKDDAVVFVEEGGVTVRICAAVGEIVPKSKYGFTREVNIVSWNDGYPMLDIRDWSEDHTRMSRGLRLSQAQANKLCDLYEKHQATAAA